MLPTPDYQNMANSAEGYSMDNDPVWNYAPERNALPFNHIAFYQCDHLGTPQELTDINGEIAWAAEYKAWGYAYEAITKAAKQAGIKNPICFQGQYFDHETGSHYNRHRYYDPHSGRYVSKDPIGLAGGMNLQAYVSNPNQWIDPLGLMGYASAVQGGIIKPTQTPKYVNCLTTCGLQVLEFETAAGASVVGGGLPVLPKRFQTTGATANTSILSSTIGNKLGKMPMNPITNNRRWPTDVLDGLKPTIKITAKLGRFASRWIPVIGWCMLAYDAYQAADCYKKCMDS